MKHFYDVYDRDGNIIVENMTSVEIGNALGFSSGHVSKCACEEQYLGNKYKIVKREVENNGTKTVKNLLLDKWEAAVAPFKKVIWVKECGPGVRKLNAQRR